MLYFAYIIESLKSGKWYYGHARNIEQRIIEHNVGQNVSTRNKDPWKLIFLRPFDTKIEANRFELKLKKLRNKGYIKKEYLEFFVGK